MYLASHVHVFVLYLVMNSVSNRDNLFILGTWALDCQLKEST